MGEESLLTDTCLPGRPLAHLYVADFYLEVCHSHRELGFPIMSHMGQMKKDMLKELLVP